MEETNFQLPVASYEVIVRIILGYFHAGASKEPISMATVADSTAMKIPNISANNRFFLSLGILERTGKGYQLTSSGLQLAQILDYYKETTSPEVQSAWKDVINNNDFLQRVTAAVKIRGNMDIEAFARHIALTSGSPNKPQFITGARTVITILQIANILIEGEDGTLRISDLETPHNAIEPQQLQTSPKAPSSLLRQTPSLPTTATIPITIAVQITPQTSDDDLERLAHKIKYLSKLINSDDTVKEEDNDKVS